MATQGSNLTADRPELDQRATYAALIGALQSTAPVGLACLDRDFRYVRVNDALAAMNRLPVGDHIGRSVGEIAPEVWDQLEGLCSEVLAGGPPVVNHEVVGDSSVGRRGHWLNSIYPVRVGDQITGLACLVIDVSERFAAEEFRVAVTETMVEGMYALDSAGRLTYMNAAAARMLGWTAAELAGRSVHDTIHYQDEHGSALVEADCPIVQARNQGRSLGHAEGIFTRRDGSTLPVAYSVAPLQADGGTPGAVVVFRNATAERIERGRTKRELDAAQWLRRTRAALDEDRLVLYSQPIVPLSGGARSEELLIRMIEPDGSIIPPGEFLPAAEQFGLITEIDRWVISQAMRFAAGGRRIEVNLSARSVDTRLIEFIATELQRAGANPTNVIFELTETALLDNIDAGRRFAEDLQQLGCELALDDFGTGFASLTYLRLLPARYLKIDIEFVRDLVENKTSRHMVRSIVHLARGLDKFTIAEGVEDEPTLELLRSYGVDYAQGYLLGRPAPVLGAGPPPKHSREAE
jgi:PAS domain S-box-containing protein